MRLTILTLVLLSACHQDDQGPSAAMPRYDLLKPCEPTELHRRSPIDAESLCGTITVFEDRAQGAGRTIDLNVMVIPAVDNVAKPDPIFFLAGGPGQAATDVGPDFFAQMPRLRAHRDIVLVDQRGTGSSNSLSCRPDDDTINHLGTTLDELVQIERDTLKHCLQTYDADTRLYTTPIAMDDLNEVREKLGYASINLYGGSYGTRAALVYMRQHGDTVRSAVLDSVVPLDMAIPAGIAVDAEAAFERMLVDCESANSCRLAFPDLRAEFPTLLERLEHTPVRLDMPHPRTGKKQPVVVEKRFVTSLIRAALYDRDLGSLLPLAIHEAYNDNFQPLMSLAYAFSRDDGPQMSNGMLASVLCAEDMKRTSAANDGKYFDNVIYSGVKPICDFWQVGSVDDDYFNPVSSAIPVLLISGMLDPVTPPKYGEQAAATLSHSLHVIVPGVGHMASLTGCMPDIIGQFLDHPDPATLNAGCVTDLKRPPFFTDFAGTASPPVLHD